MKEYLYNYSSSYSSFMSNTASEHLVNDAGRAKRDPKFKRSGGRCERGRYFIDTSRPECCNHYMKVTPIDVDTTCLIENFLYHDEFRGHGESDYCGCCGREIGPFEDWCRDCTKHVLNEGPLHEKTYFAQFSVECPFSNPPSNDGTKKAA